MTFDKLEGMIKDVLDNLSNEADANALHGIVKILLKRQQHDKRREQAKVQRSKGITNMGDT